MSSSINNTTSGDPRYILHLALYCFTRLSIIPLLSARPLVNSTPSRAPSWSPSATWLARRLGKVLASKSMLLAKPSTKQLKPRGTPRVLWIVSPARRTLSSVQSRETGNRSLQVRSNHWSSYVLSCSMPLFFSFRPRQTGQGGNSADPQPERLDSCVSFIWSAPCDRCLCLGDAIAWPLTS